MLSGSLGMQEARHVSIVVRPKVLPKFKVGKELRVRVNGGVDTEE